MTHDECSQESLEGSDVVSNNVPVLDFEMLTVDEVSKSPGGIQYIMSGMHKDHIKRLAATIDAIFSRPQILTDDEFKNAVIAEIDTIKKSIDELYKGVQIITDVLKQAGRM
jgi:hypothetical protein